MSYCNHKKENGEYGFKTICDIRTGKFSEVCFWCSQPIKNIIKHDTSKKLFIRK